MAQIEPTDLYAIIVSAVIFGSAITGISAWAVIRYSRQEERGEKPNFTYGMFLALVAAALCLYGIWRAGFFG